MLSPLRSLKLTCLRSWRRHATAGFAMRLMISSLITSSRLAKAGIEAWPARQFAKRRGLASAESPSIRGAALSARPDAPADHPRQRYDVRRRAVAGLAGAASPLGGCRFRGDKSTEDLGGLRASPRRLKKMRWAPCVGGRKGLRELSPRELTYEDTTYQRAAPQRSVGTSLTVRGDLVLSRLALRRCRIGGAQ